MENFSKGDIVTYVPRHARNNESHPDREVGKVTSVNDTYVFVDYGTGNSKATRPEDLVKGDKTFYCYNENNSVLDGAFGRCMFKCSECR